VEKKGGKNLKEAKNGRTGIEFLTEENKPLGDVYNQLKNVYGDMDWEQSQ
jgi:hypothetical protein